MAESRYFPSSYEFVKDRLRATSGGDGGIRTLGKDVSLRRFSKPLVSATHPRLRITAVRWPYSEGIEKGQGVALTLLPQHCHSQKLG
jgi:hypothetical protein